MKNRLQQTRNRRRKAAGGAGGKSGFRKPGLDPALRKVFKKIGVPEPEAFRADPFQLQALQELEGHDVLVSAPTGAGKTWIAEQAIASLLEKGKKVWYASPLKALSNAVYHQFCREFGNKTCGILTGDRKENPEAPIIVGTTEILRNQLYDAMHRGESIGTDLVILDEAHYLSDQDRGVVWEEVLIYLPARVRLLLLSATLSNAEEISAWLEENRGVPTRVVRSDERPVPLEFLFLFPDGLIAPLAGKRGLTPRVKKFLGTRTQARRRRAERIDFGRIIGVLRKFDLLPAIFFLKSRADCDAALQTCRPVQDPGGLRVRMEAEAARFLSAFPHLERHRQMRILLDARVGSHHGGQLPSWKLFVEEMMKKGYLEAIFSTSTVAAGVNFPARTVVLTQSDRYNGREFIDLTATELHQMIGRAGRRGKDRIGFALLIPGLYQDPELIVELRDSPPEPIRSRIHINFSMTLNLLLSQEPEEIKNLLGRSFAAFQERKSGSTLAGRLNQLVSEIEEAIPKGKCDTADPYEVIENIQKRVELKKTMEGMRRTLRYETMIDTYGPYLKPGRLFLHRNGGVYLLFDTFMEEGRLICAAHNVQRKIGKRKRRPRLRKVDLAQVRGIFDYRVRIPDDYTAAGLRRLLESVPGEGLEMIDLEASDAVEEPHSGKVQERTMSFPCEDCEHFRDCHIARKGELRKLLRDFRRLADRMEGRGGVLWLNFKRHLRFLKETGFVTHDDRLTPDGEWASRLRLDQPLLIAEAIRKGAFAEAAPEKLAGGLAPFVWDRGQEVEIRVRHREEVEEIEDLFTGIARCIEPLRRLKSRRGFENPSIQFWPAAAVYFWARGMPWEVLLERAAVDEGDLASLIVRTADHLRQVTGLRDTHPDLAAAAEEAIALIMRDPVYLD